MDSAARRAREVIAVGLFISLVGRSSVAKTIGDYAMF
jgi:hypothetical protein